MNRKKEIIRALKFLFFSASAGIIQILSFTLLNEVFHLNYWACYLPSLLLSIVWCFTMNRNFTFKSANNIPIAMAKMLLFYAVFTPTTTILGNFLVEELLWNEYIVTAMNMILNFVLEFLYQRFFVFGKSIDTK